MSPLLGIVIVVIVGLSVMVGILAQRLREPAHSPRVFLNRGRKRGTRSVIVCAGDSITHGIGSADYVQMLEKQFAGQGCEFVNAGINSELAWNVAQRLPQIIACQPDVVTLLVGTNDVNATMNQAKEDLYRKEQRLPEKPTLEWYIRNVEHIIDSLHAGTQARIAILTIPMLGEVLDSPLNQRIRQYNAALESIAQAKGIPLLPLYDRLVSLIPPDHKPPAYEDQTNLITSSFLKHYVLGKSWNAISAEHGLVVLTDHIHLNDRAAAVIAELIAGFIKQG